MVAFSLTGTPTFMLASELTHLSSHLRSPRRALNDAISGPVRAGIRRNFDTEGRHSGPAWPALTASTIHRRHSEGYPGGPILDRRRGAVGLKYGAQARSNWTIRGNTAEFTTLPRNVFYGHYHQTGFASSQGGNVPARPFVRFPESDLRDVETVLMNWVEMGFSSRYLV